MAYKLVISLTLLAVASANPVIVSHPLAGLTASQFHVQDELGQYSFGYQNPNSARTEMKDLTGVTRGSYSYVGPDGQLIINNYVADENGFRSSLAPSDGNAGPIIARIPVAPPTPFIVHHRVPHPQAPVFIHDSQMTNQGAPHAVMIQSAPSHDEAIMIKEAQMMKRPVIVIHDTQMFNHEAPQAVMINPSQDEAVMVKEAPMMNRPVIVIHDPQMFNHEAPQAVMINPSQDEAAMVNKAPMMKESVMMNHDSQTFNHEAPQDVMIKPSQDETVIEKEAVMTNEPVTINGILNKDTSSVIKHLMEKNVPMEVHLGSVMAVREPAMHKFNLKSNENIVLPQIVPSLLTMKVAKPFHYPVMVQSYHHPRQYSYYKPHPVQTYSHVW